MYLEPQVDPKSKVMTQLLQNPHYQNTYFTSGHNPIRREQTVPLSPCTPLGNWKEHVKCLLSSECDHGLVGHHLGCTQNWPLLGIIHKWIIIIHSNCDICSYNIFHRALIHVTCVPYMNEI